MARPNLSTDATNPSMVSEELSAYLDGELSPKSKVELERRLAGDPRLKRELQQLQRAWGMLDQLPTAKVEESFSRSTLAKVTTVATEELSEQQSRLPRRRRLVFLALGTAALAATLAGLLLGRTLWADPNARLLRDLPLLEELDLYRHAESVEFLKKLDQEGLFPEEPEHAS